MTILFLYGMPEGVNGLRVLTSNLRESVFHFPDFELVAEQVSVFYPADQMSEGLGEELILMVDGFFALPKRTFKLRTEWTDALRDILVDFAKEHVRHCSKVEVCVRLFDPNFNTFANWEASK